MRCDTAIQHNLDLVVTLKAFDKQAIQLGMLARDNEQVPRSHQDNRRDGDVCAVIPRNTGARDLARRPVHGKEFREAAIQFGAALLGPFAAVVKAMQHVASAPEFQVMCERLAGWPDGAMPSAAIELLAATITPEDTLRSAGIDDQRQAEYQRKMSAMLGGHE